MKLSLCYFVIAAQVLLSAVVATSRPLAYDAPTLHPTDKTKIPMSSSSQHALISPNEAHKNMSGADEKVNEEAFHKGVSKIGSRPPSCDHKCYGCTPCEAIQVPTITSHLGVLYTNYEPEGWKCKCGPALYSP
ncbi:hypothetical protein RJ641_024010 [Dillenia turbinata]|uniref:Epidermal patterning factor-like protein n=1 Tax=Dillenia turbinata TaxID=194707 RepID=A0AAN8UJZ9_9MAGN